MELLTTFKEIIIQENPFLLFSLMTSFLLLIASYKVWWVHVIPAVITILIAWVFIKNHTIAIEILSISNLVFVRLSQDLESKHSLTQTGLIWFAGTGLILAAFMTAKEPIILKEIINENGIFVQHMKGKNHA